jgi:hypothetical protein
VKEDYFVALFCGMRVRSDKYKRKRGGREMTNRYRDWKSRHLRTDLIICIISLIDQVLAFKE